MFEKLKFWKKEPELEELKTDFGDLHSKDPFGSQQDFGLGMDRTAGLGGTGSLAQPTQASPSYAELDQPEHTIQGRSFGTYPNQQRLTPTELSTGNSGLSRELELISSKLDAIKAMVDSVNQRLEHIERQSRDAYKRW